MQLFGLSANWGAPDGDKYIGWMYACNLVSLLVISTQLLRLDCRRLLSQRTANILDTCGSIVILLMMVLPAGVGTIIVALAITGWVNMARLVRARILQLKGQEFVMAAQVLGTSQKNIILRHLIPNTVGVIVINAMFTIPSAIFTRPSSASSASASASPRPPWAYSSTTAIPSSRTIPTC